MADEDDEYEQEFEASGDDTAPARSPLEGEASFQAEFAPPSPLTVSESRQSVLQPDSDSVEPPTRKAKPVAKKKPIRSVLEQSPWTFTIQAKRIRALRIPVAPPAANGGGNAIGLPTIRDLRVFGVVDKQSMQTHGSRWKQEARVAENARPTVSSRRSPSNAMSPGRRSGFFEEAQWKNDDGELQWTFTLDKFRRLKAYSPRIKLFVFGIGVNAHVDSVRALSEDSPRQHKESLVSLGWFFLDMRTPDLPERWLKLQNSPFGGEIQVASSFLPADLGRTRASGAEVRDSRTMETGGAATRRRDHLFEADSDSLQLGSRRGSDIFLVSVFIQGATRLATVARSALGFKDHEKAAAKSGFWLSYSLFDVVVQTDVFYNLDHAEFAPIRDSFRVMSCKEDLQEFVQTQRVVTVYLCTQDRVLASAELPLDALSRQLELFGGRFGSGHHEDKATVSGTFAFAGTSEGDSGVAASFSIEYVETVRKREGDGEESKRAHDEYLPVQRVSDPPVADRVESASSSPVFVTVSHVKLSATTLGKYAEKEAIELEVMVGEQAVRCPIHFNAFTADYALGHCPDLVLELDFPPTESTELSVSCFSSATDHAIAASSSNPSSSHQLRARDQLHIALNSQDGARIGECTLVSTSAHSTERKRSKSQDELRSIPGLSHTYRLLIRLAALRDFETNRPVVVSYTNPFTGRERVETSLISVIKKAESSISDAYCVFELHYDETTLKEAMESPVIMDVSLALPDGSRETIGSAIFSLNFLFYSEQGVCCAHPSCEAVFRSEDEAHAHWEFEHRNDTASTLHAAITHTIKTCSIYLPVMSPGPTTTTRRVGALKIEAYIEDTGPMSEEQVRLVDETRISRLIFAQEHRTEFENRRSNRSVASSENLLRVASVDVQSSRNESLNNEENKLADVSATSDKELGEMKVRLQQERNAWLQEQNAQQAQWRKRVAEMEKARMDELEEEWARREEERSAVLKAAQAEYQKLEQKLRITLADVETRERKLALAESALERDQRMLREDTDVLRKRLQSEQSHSVSLAQKQVDALEKRVTELQSHLNAAEKRALQVEEDFAEYRKQQRKVPESKLREEISSLKGQVAELEKAKFAETRSKEQAEANAEKMKSQLEKMAKLVQAEKKKNESRVVDELEKLRLKYVAREERYVLDGDREELRAIKKQLDELRHVHVRGHDASAVDDALRVRRSQARVKPKRPSHDVVSRGSRGSMVSLSPTRRDGRRHSWSSAEVDAQSPSPARSPLRPTSRPQRKENRPLNVTHDDKEIRRLERERESLLASGAYDHDSYLVRELERRIVLRQDELARR